MRESKYEFLRALYRLLETFVMASTERIDNASEPDGKYFTAAHSCSVNGVAEVFGRLEGAGWACMMLKPFSGHVEDDAEQAAIHTIELAIRLPKSSQEIVLIVDCTKNERLAVLVEPARSILRLVMLHYPQTLAKAVVVGSKFRQRLASYLFASVLLLIA